MKTIKQIEDIEKVSTIENKLIYIKKNKLFEINGKHTILILDKIYDYHNIGKFIYYQEANLESLYRLHIQSREVEKLHGMFSLRGSFGNSEETVYILGKYDSHKVYFKISINDYVIENIIPFSMGLPKIFNKKFCVVEYRDSIKSFESLFENEIWNYTLPAGYTIYKSIQQIDDVLFFIAYKDNHYQLVTGLDIESGNVLYQNQYEVTNERKFISAHAYNPLDKLFYGLGDVYQIFNPKTGEIVLEKIVEECESKVIRPYVNSIYENKLWFISGKYEDVRFGCLDLDTQEVEFIQDFPQENDEMFEAPIYHENKLYLKGIHYNQLYVFE